MKGETVGRDHGLRERDAREVATRVRSPEPVLDTCGTGGDGSTPSTSPRPPRSWSAGAGVTVAKHGNRAHEQQVRQRRRAGGAGREARPAAGAGGAAASTRWASGSCSRPLFHPAMKHAVGPRGRSASGPCSTSSGPLTNPAGASAGASACSRRAGDERWRPCSVSLGCDTGMVVHGMDGLDELSTARHDEGQRAGRTDGCDATPSTPEDVGLHGRQRRRILAGGTREENAALLRTCSTATNGPRRDIVLLNAAAALVVAGVVRRSQRGRRAWPREAIDCGARAHEARAAGRASARSAAEAGGMMLARRDSRSAHARSLAGAEAPRPLSPCSKRLARQRPLALDLAPRRSARQRAWR